MALVRLGIGRLRCSVAGARLAISAWLLGLLAFGIVGCSTQQMVVGGGNAAANLFGLGLFGYGLEQETAMFIDHWDILNDGHLPRAVDVPENDRKRLESDLNELGEKISREILRLESSNDALRAARYHQNLKSFPGFKVVLTRVEDAEVRAVQDDKHPRVEVSLGLLYQHLNSSADLIRREKIKVRSEWSSRLSGEDLDNEVTARASIPGALEYKEALLFLVAHEAVHLWLDPPDTIDDEVRHGQEVRADALGLTIVSNISYIVTVRQKNEGVEAAVLNLWSGSPRDIQRAVLFARSGPEYLFEVNQAIFGNSSPIYRSVAERQSDAAIFMKKAVYGNLKTPADSYIFYLLSRLGSQH